LPPNKIAKESVLTTNSADRKLYCRKKCPGKEAFAWRITTLKYVIFILAIEKDRNRHNDT